MFTLRYEKTCNLCHISFSSITSYYLKHSCIKKKSFDEKIGLESHRKQLCPIPGCLKWFSEGHSMQGHLRSHTLKFICVNCLQVASNKSAAIKHLCIESSRKPENVLKDAIPVDQFLDKPIEAVSDEHKSGLKKFFKQFHPAHHKDESCSACCSIASSSETGEVDLMDCYGMMDSALQHYMQFIEVLSANKNSVPLDMNASTNYSTCYDEVLSIFIQFNDAGDRVNCFLSGCPALQSPPIMLFTESKSAHFTTNDSPHIIHRILTEFFELDTKKLFLIANWKERLKYWCQFYFMRAHWHQLHGCLTPLGFVLENDTIKPLTDLGSTFTEGFSEYFPLSLE